MGAYSFAVASDVPDQHAIIFELEATDGTNTWNNTFNIIAHAPLLETGSFTIDDTATGNGDNFWDAGETVDIILDVVNSGSSEAFTVVTELMSNDPYVIINSASSIVGNLASGTTATATFNITSNIATPMAHLATLGVEVSADNGITGIGSIEVLIGGYLLEEYFDSFPPTGWTTSESEI